MKRYQILSLSLLILLPMSLFSQQFNQSIEDPVRNRPILIDQIDRQGLLTGEMGEFFQVDYDAYLPEDEVVDSLRNSYEGIRLHVVLGSWCGDSKEQMPRLLKVLDQSGFDISQLMMTGVDSHKKGRTTDVGPLEILKVPTVIVYRDGKEAGRIIETPVETLEKDLLNILRNSR